MTVRDLFDMLRDDGWYRMRLREGLHQFNHPMRFGTITLAFGRDVDAVPLVVRRSISRQAGWR